ncbi:AAA family ATPase [Bradyrhizobium sp. CCGUVB1N3]|uniref:AAA family ATPase n=1 Tax=Bradyrhizobium sp. CCGUVB1N3 TaxID=2949629 RepID=UPI0020B43DBD|nr:AAA family ATPase [Bradyrhizobium sp. CCGUVB1N3]MCP3475613.1 AAA family ATPase [Bradyrhizobium sp. CCGUVB1N3]
MWEDGERILCRGIGRADRDCAGILAVLPAAEHPTPATLDRFAHEYRLKDRLDAAWAVRPLELVREHGRMMLLLEDPGGEPLAVLLRGPVEVERFLRLAIGLATALGKVHQRELIHKDLKPANILVNCADGRVRLTGFGIASRLPRERQTPDPPEVIAGTLAYMAPEQTGRMNRSLDARSDLYAVGVILYQMLTGVLPFTATEPMDWVHCHIARRPTPPAERVPGLSAALSAIVMKCLAKNAEDRYQTAAGLAADLKRCLAEWEGVGDITPFAPGAADIPDVLRIPEKLYGREREVAELLAAFERVVAGGPPELVLVSGYSGIGKSALVNELHKSLVPPRGLFAAGKFDQYKRGVPYATLAQALQSLVRPILGQSEAELGHWRDRFQEALGLNGALIVNLVPELELVIGKQPRVSDLSPEEMQARFQTVFRRFLGVFARPEHPLALFLDDLQWHDTATLDVLQHLATHPDVRHLFLVGAYRDNEVGPTHPLMRMQSGIRKGGGAIHEIVLKPLALDDVGRLISDTMRCDRARAQPLAELVQEKTTGNPFFAIQFVSALAGEGLIVFDPGAAAWTWDLAGIRAKGYTDNVVEFMVGKLSRLPDATQEALKQLACLGNSADIATLKTVYETSEGPIHAALSEAIRAGLVLRLDDAYKFLHDRVLEAAYALIPVALRPEVHLRIGRRLVAGMPEQETRKKIFDLVNQFNLGSSLVSDWAEKQRVAELNLHAGKKAKASTAYNSASSYLSAGAALLAEEGWRACYALTFGLCLERADCELLRSNFETAAQLIEELLRKARSKIDRAEAYRLEMVLRLMQGDNSSAVRTALECLQMFGLELPERPAEEQVREEYDGVLRDIGERSIGSLIDLPLTDDPEMFAVMNILAALCRSAYFRDTYLCQMVACRMVHLSLRHGTSESSTIGYAWMAILGPVLHHYKEGEQFGQLAIDVAEKYAFTAQKVGAYFSMQMAVLWTRPIGTALTCLDTALRYAEETGENIYACYSLEHRLTDLIARGDNLEQIWLELVKSLNFVRGLKFRHVIAIISSMQPFIQSLRGDPPLDEAEIEGRALEGGIAVVIGYHWILQLQRQFLLGSPAAALEHAAKIKPILWSVRCHIQSVDYFFYHSLALAAVFRQTPQEQQTEIRAALTTNLDVLRQWAESCPATFSNRYLLVSAEIARLEERELESERFYEQAIRSARDNGFVQNEALAYELAARFHAARGFDDIAHLYLRNARDNYARWGADGKVRQLEDTFPHLRKERPEPGSISTIGEPVENLDLATVIKVSEAVSSEMVLEKLIDTLMRTAVEQAGAERGLLILSQGAEPRIGAEATTSGDTVIVQLREVLVTAAVLPESVLHYVLRTRECAILDDATVQPPFATDPYVGQRQARSILCLPLVNHAKLVGALYLENTLTPHVFAPARVAVLKLLASQAAIALENARLYRDVSEREAKIRRLVDANVIGITIWQLGGQILDANDAFLRIVGYDREDLILGRLHWTDLTPPEWLERQERLWIPELKMIGTVQPFEQEYFRKGGSRVPVLIGMAAFDEQREQGVCFVVDLTERKRSEEAQRESEERFRTLVQFSFDVYWESDAQHRFTRQEFGAGFADAPAPGYEIGKTRWEVPYLEPDADAWRKHREALDAHLPFRDFELARPTPDGDKRYASISGLPVFDKAGHFVGYRGVARDITERKRAAEALREVQKELTHANRLATMGELTASIAHEVSQPIAAASMNADAALRFLGRNPPEVERARQVLGCLVKDSDRASDIIGRIRDLVKRAPPRKDRLDINEAIRDVIELSRSEALKNSVSVQTEPAKNLPLVEGDRVQLQQVVLNLILNAIQAMGPVADGSRQMVITTAEVEPESVQVAVKDSGPGLVPGSLERVFEPFYTTKPGGLGVGLSICRSIVEAHGGRLWVTANAPRGAIFHFTVPAHPGNAS